jgi:hypothetical protein
MLATCIIVDDEKSKIIYKNKQIGTDGQTDRKKVAGRQIFFSFVRRSVQLMMPSHDAMMLAR